MHSNIEADNTDRRCSDQHSQVVVACDCGPRSSAEFMRDGELDASLSLRIAAEQEQSASGCKVNDENGQQLQRSER